MVTETIANDALFYKNTPPMILGEGPIYRNSDKTLHYLDCLKDPCELHILQLDDNGDLKEGPRILKLEDSVTVAFFRRNKPKSYICAYFAGVAFLDETTGKLDIVKEIIPPHQRDILRFNDGGCDVKGRFWLAEIDRKGLKCGFGNLPKDHKPLGRLWRYDPDGSLHKMEEGIVCGNGLAWSPDNKTFYLNDSVSGLIYAYDFEIETGNITSRRIFVDKREDYGEPDGMVIDREGNIWVAMYGTYCVMVYSPEGKHLQTVRFSARNMTCTTWGGPNFDTLYIASGESKPGQPKDDGGHLFKYKPGGVRGDARYEFDG